MRVCFLFILGDFIGEIFPLCIYSLLLGILEPCSQIPSTTHMSLYYFSIFVKYNAQNSKCIIEKTEYSIGMFWVNIGIYYGRNEKRRLSISAVLHVGCWAFYV